MMSTDGTLEVGGSCFAKVKGWVPYPARIVDIQKKSKGLKYSVIFFVTNETGDFWSDSIWSASPSNVVKFVTEKSLKRKHFKAAYNEMIEYQRSEKMGDVEDNLNEKTAAENDDEFDVHEEFSALFNNNEVVQMIPLSKELVGGLVDEESDEEEEDGILFGKGKPTEALEVTREIPPESAVAAPKSSLHSKKAEEKKDKNDKNRKEKAGKKPEKAKRNMALRESEMAANEAFAEKIVVNIDNSFSCKDCPLFATKIRLLARSHALSCGRKKMAGRRAKQWSCDQCDQLFSGKKELVEHIHRSHSQPQYQCSVCLKKFQYRKSYRRHLMIHSNEPGVVACPHCPKTFRFNSYMKRHVDRVHKTNLDLAGSDVVDDVIDNTVSEGSEDLVSINIDQVEAKCDENYYWEVTATFPNSEKRYSSSYEEFYNTLGLHTKEQWDDWILVSKMLGLPISADGSNNELEMAITKHANGEESIVCAGSTIATAANFVAGIEDTMADFTLEENNYGSNGDMPRAAEIIEEDGNLEGSTCVTELLDEPVDEVAGPTEVEGGLGEGGACSASVPQVLSDSSGSGTEFYIEGLLDTLSQQQVFQYAMIEHEQERVPITHDNKDDDKQKQEEQKTRQQAELITCEHCGVSGFRNTWFLKRHILQLHVGSVKCNICEIVFIDKYRYLEHSKTCFYWCDREGCSYHEKRQSRMESHRRRHDREY